MSRYEPSIETGKTAPRFLTREGLSQGLEWLSRRDRDLAGIVERLGAPPLWARRPGFATLLHIILEQQVSLASAEAAFRRLCATCKPLTPRVFLKLDDAALGSAGFSRQKTAYGQNLAHALVTGRLDLPGLKTMDDESVRVQLTQVKGVGRWSAEIYLLMALRRPDIWPLGDLALAKAAQRVKGLRAVPGPVDLDKLGASWRPWRSVAARLLWHHYLRDAKQPR
ncbi:MAG: DNA-3-methyladenine glycosylase family protein [Burkholderiales bacterium]